MFSLVWIMPPRVLRTRSAGRPAAESLGGGMGERLVEWERFHELARLVPHLVTPESRMIERYVYGLALQIREMVAAMKSKSIQKTVQISSALTDEAVRT
ncbi:hypothetical protein Tco_0628355 [Tanacetum coccineum]|uniref:Uncharacterized protein n=1 Tax=Tanacetum coccineum TaxID=301880 RepID=A0ABQ4WQ89_9ASTR